MVHRLQKPFGFSPRLTTVTVTPRASTQLLAAPSCHIEKEVSARYAPWNGMALYVTELLAKACD